MVTGGASGIGRVLVERLVQEDARVVSVDLDPRGVEDEAVEHVVADVARAEEITGALEMAEQRYGRIDLLVNNAAVAAADNVAAMTEEEWDGDVAVSLKGPFLTTRAVLKGMVERRSGVIVNIVSVNALAYFGNEAYSAAKAGLISLTTSTAVRFGRYGIRANAVAPGTIRTSAWDKRLAADPTVLDQVTKWYPLGRVGEPDDVVNAVLFLASEEAAWITGSVLRVDGGLLAGNNQMVEEAIVEARSDPPGSSTP